MSKSHMLYAVAALFATFFALQFYLIHNVTKQREQFYEHVARKAARRDAATKAALDRRKVAHDNVNDFVSACQLAGSPVFLADADVLTAIMSNGTPATVHASKPECRYLCSTRSSILLFAVDAKLWLNERVIISQLESELFSITWTEQPNPWTSSSSSSSQHHPTIRTHLSLQRSGHTVLLILLYSLDDKELGGHAAGAAGAGVAGSEPVWWYGACTSGSTCPPLHTLSQANQHWLQHQGLIDVVELTKVTIDQMPLRAPRYPKQFYAQIPSSRFLPCNHTRAQEFSTQYGIDADDESTLFKQEARELLSQANAVLNQLGVRFWISSGTALGWFRQCDIIPYSRDVDLGVWIKDYNKELIPAMARAGLPLKHLFGKESDSFELSFQSPHSDIKLDVFFFFEDEHFMWNGGTQARTGKKFKYIFPKFTLCWTLLLGLKVRIPCDTQSYIQANYGPNWFHPVKEWDWKKSPPNVWENGAWPQKEWSQVIQTF